MNAILGSLIEAWGELKINRGRVILSLISVGAAVWAMATVLALGSLLSTVQDHYNRAWGEAPGMVNINASPSQSDLATGPGAGDMPGYEPRAGEDQKEPERVTYRDGMLTDPFGKAAYDTVSQLGVSNWTRSTKIVTTIRANGFAACSDDDLDCYNNEPAIMGVDPLYAKLYGHQLVTGRLLNDADGQLQMNPVVVEYRIWERMGFPSLEQYPRMYALQGDKTITMVIVGVVKDLSKWNAPNIFMHYDGLASSFNTTMNQNEPPKLTMVVPVGEEEQAFEVSSATLQSLLGESYEVSGYYQEDVLAGAAQQQRTLTAVVAAIGGIVISLGALGLLTVSIVTVRQRIREIGIRRAMGASARRIFLTVFLESVVATTFAGILGVMASVMTFKIAPIENIKDLPISVSTIPYPLTAAFVGVVISAFVGALAGIIPATIAVRVKPIDAIRY